MGALKSALFWAKKWWKVLAGAAGAITLGLLAWNQYQRRTATLGDSVKVERAKMEIAELRGRREQVAREHAIDEAEVAEIDAKLEDNKRAIEAARRRAEVPEEDLQDEFARLGY